ncbi:MAG: TetR/AcrR family transcriptional regulator [Firmicutes bacterium]|nr:TetR/AcrR family transcriptional regulator [Bacillota bacterium]
MNEKDRRVLKTKEALKGALLRLTCFKEPGSISIKELTEAAGMNRSTFYDHYRDVYELYDEVEQDALAKVRGALTEGEFPDRGAIYCAVIDVLQSSADTFMVLMRDGSNGSFEEAMAQMFEMAYLQNELTENQLESFSEDRRFLLAYHTQGCIGILKKWIKEGCRYPKEELVKRMCDADTALHSLF